MTISQKHSGLRTTNNVFLCIVKRASVFNVFFHPERWEVWKVLADTREQAIDAANYHFYRSREQEIMVSTTPIY